MTSYCLYCEIRLPDVADFCPECGRPIERGYRIRPTQQSVPDHPQRKELLVHSSGQRIAHPDFGEDVARVGVVYFDLAA